MIREWRSALLNAVQNGYPLTDDFVAGYQNQRDDKLAVSIRGNLNRLRSNRLSVAQQRTKQYAEVERQNHGCT